MRPGRLLLLALGSLAALAALALLVGGGVLLWASETKRDGDGFYNTPSARYRTPAYALVSTDLDVAVEAPHWLVDSSDFARVRIRGTGRDPKKGIFIGIAPAPDAAAYLAGAEHDVVVDVDFRPFALDFARRPGSRRPRGPTSQDVWTASTYGGGLQTLDWKVENGTWAVVVMNADGSRGVDVDLVLGAKVSFVRTLAIALLGGGGGLALVSALLLRLGVRRRPRPEAPPPGAPASPPDVPAAAPDD